MIKQAIMTSPGVIKFNEVTAPMPGPGEVLLRIQLIGVCGSDVHVYHGKHPYTSYPVVQGHEYSATVEEIGEGVTGLDPGMKVTSMPQIFCGSCAACLRGDYHICDHLRVQGFQAPGCGQELWVTEAKKIIQLPDTFTFEQGALVEPIAVAAHAIRRAGNVDGKHVAVLGAGPIGNLVAQVAFCSGAQVLISDVSQFRLDVAEKCGLVNTMNVVRETLNAASLRVFGQVGFDIAFECVGLDTTIASAITSIQKGGTIIVVGVFGEKPRLDLGLVQDRELNLRGTLMYQREDYERAVELIISRGVKTTPLISKHFPFEQYLDAYHFIDQQGDKSMKVFIDVCQEQSI